ncbi:MAG: PIN domain-containing protein [Deltaproteobacteria bacterium]|nr:PIN domain-containing protein [Deltaproteobacteria bacterium]
MKVLVDTSIWSLALRRKESAYDPLVRELEELIREFRVHIIGPVRQEILSGIRSKEQFENLKKHFRSFPDMELHEADYECAAEFFNIARKKGIQGSNTDFLICAAANRYGMTIFTNDKDFTLFQKCLPVKLHRSRLR